MSPFDRKLLEYLLEYVTPRRQRRFAKVLRQRTRRITVVLEDFFGSHNIAAVLRSCDAFGIQDVHVIEDSHEFQLEPVVALGSQKWLSVHRYTDGPSPGATCLAALRQKGYRLLAVTPHADAQPPEDVDLSEPCALVFGSEKEGLSATAVESADGAVRIPMVGFVESLNVSVAAAVCLYPMVNRLRNDNRDWGLTDEEQESLLLEWVKQTVPHLDALEARFQEEFVEDSAGAIERPPAAVDR